MTGKVFVDSNNLSLVSKEGKGVSVGGMIYHARNRANFRYRLFRQAAPYQDLLASVDESLPFLPMRMVAYCLIPNAKTLASSRAAPRSTRTQRLARQGRN